MANSEPAENAATANAPAAGEGNTATAEAKVHAGTHAQQAKGKAKDSKTARDSKTTKDGRPKPRLPRGLVDRAPADLAATESLLTAIRASYTLYGFEPVETPLIEYADCLGKFLPDQDRPNEGVFAFQDDDEEWLALRYDLTAPLARYVAENYDRLPKPYRSYRVGWVFRNEKPGPGRFRQFMQFDADTVGTASVAADAEICMMAADTLEKLGIPRGDYVIRINNRKVLDGVMEAAGLAGAENAGRRLTVLRAIDKLDKIGPEGVRDLLGEGRLDPSGDFTRGAGLEGGQIERILAFTVAGADDPAVTCANLAGLVETSPRGSEGVAELTEIAGHLAAAGYGPERIRIDPSVVRGLEYYTGPVFEAELTFTVLDDEGRPVLLQKRLQANHGCIKLRGQLRRQHVAQAECACAAPRPESDGKGAGPRRPSPVLTMVTKVCATVGLFARTTQLNAPWMSLIITVFGSPPEGSRWLMNSPLSVTFVFR